MIDALLATLEREADAEIARVKQEAEARAAALTAAAEQRMTARRNATLSRHETAARAEHERALATARVAARAKVLAARAELLERVFERLRQELPKLTVSPAYRAGLPSQIGRLKVFAGDDPVTLQCNPTLAAALRRVVKTNGRLRIHPDRRIAAGFRLITADGVLEVDATLESRLERLRPRLALETLAALST
jgi:V/A-type H+-transporting ATPase subunit E